MDAGTVIWTLLLGLTYGYLLYYFTGYRVIDFLIKIYYGYSFRRFDAFYEMVQDGYVSYKYFNHPKITNVEYLQAFDTYDVETAYSDIRQSLRRSLYIAFRSSLLRKLSLLFSGYVLFPEPLYGLAVVCGYYIVRLGIRLLGPYGISTPTIVLSREFVDRACHYAYGPKKSGRLLAQKKRNSAAPAVEITDRSLLGRTLALNRRLWEGKNWVRTFLTWIVGFVPIGFIGMVSIPIITDIIGALITLYMLFPASYALYRVQVLVNEDEAPEA